MEIPPNLIFRKEAIEDLDQAYRWYENQREGLGQEFILSVEKAWILFRIIPNFIRKSIRKYDELW